MMENQRQETYSGASTKRCKRLPREIISWVRISKKMYVVLEQSGMKSGTVLNFYTLDGTVGAEEH